MIDMTVKLQVFEGPLDLLLHLLEKNKVNIYDIPIAEITNQYMEYIAEMKRQDLNIAASCTGDRGGGRAGGPACRAGTAAFGI